MIDKNNLKKYVQFDATVKETGKFLAQAIQKGDERAIQAAKLQLGELAEQETDGRIARNTYTNQSADYASTWIKNYSAHAQDQLASTVNSDFDQALETITETQKLIQIALSTEPQTTGNQYHDLIAEKHIAALKRQEEFSTDNGQPDLNAYIKLFDDLPYLQRLAAIELSTGNTNLFDAYIQAPLEQVVNGFRNQEGDKIDKKKVARYIKGNYTAVTGENSEQKQAKKRPIEARIGMQIGLEEIIKEHKARQESENGQEPEQAEQEYELPLAA